MTGVPASGTLLAGDNPQTYIPGDRRRALARGEELPHRSRGAALFVDISGFTPLTEALVAELGARRGAEELSETLETVFAALLEGLHVWRGSVVYFSGDAVTAWVDGDDGTRAVACAQQMQRTMGVVGRVRTPGGREVTLTIKVAVAVGEVHRFVVGDPDIQLIDVLAGTLMDSLAAAEQQAVSGDVVVDAGTITALGSGLRLRATRDGEHGAVGVVDGLAAQPVAPRPQAPPPDLPDEVVRQWLLPPVWERLAAGRGEFLAELRPAVPVFVRFGGLDFERDPTAPSVLDEFVRLTQRVLDDQGGYVLQLTIGDKGAYLYAVLGSPTAHEDDAARACEAALQLLESSEDVAVEGVQIGLATGRLRSGTYGHPQRRTFCCLGDAVNLSARLMSRAPAGGVWVHGDVAAATGDAFVWREMDPLTVKGKAEPVAVRELVGRAGRRRARLHTGGDATLVGRDDVLAQLHQLWERAHSGRGQVAVIAAEPGIGKSRLVATLLERLVADGVPIAVGEATPLGARAAYTAWRGAWADLLDVDLDAGLDAGPDAGTRDAPNAIDQGEALRATVAALEPAVVDRVPLLGPVLGLDLPDTPLTAGFDSELRKNSTEDLLARLLAARAAAGPLCLVVEDCHWLDPLSGDVLTRLARVVAGASVLLVLTSRTLEPRAGLVLPASVPATDLQLSALAPDAARELAASRYRSQRDDEAPAGLLDMVVERSEGNPFYLEQLVDYVASRAAAGTGAGVEDLELPSSLHSLVLSRIDAQGEGPRRAVKVASVVGREFSSSLVAQAYPELGVPDGVHDDLLTVAATRLVDLEDPQARRFAFGHAVTRDVAYDSLPHGIRTVLHARVGDVLEAEPDGARRHLDLLAFHYARSENPSKARRYLLAAAESARNAYANATAVEHLRAALPFVPEADEAAVLLELSEALSLVGDWPAAEDVVARAAARATARSDGVTAARAAVAQAELDRRQGRYAEALERLGAAGEAFAAAGDDAGRARVLHLRGTLASQQGDVETARASYEESLALRRALGDRAGTAAMLTNLGLVAEDEGDLDTAERLGEEGLAIRRSLGDSRAVSVCLTNLGMLAQGSGQLDLARARFAEGLGLAEEVGDPWILAVSRHNLGNVTRDLGDVEPAARLLDDALAAYLDLDDLWSLAHVFEDVAVLALRMGGAFDAEAARLVAGAAALREQIGAPRFPPTEAELDGALAPARQRTASEVMGQAEATGASDDVAASAQLARSLLGVVG